VSVCPKGIVALDGAALNARGYHPAAVYDTEKCIACAFCAVMCPDAVIKLER
jgi:2-oxoglutarate ferredoxin oxidoreductase subunit delta